MSAGRVRDLGLHLLDRQVVDTQGEPVGKVDDVEISDEGYVVALLLGPQALAGRLGGLLGGWLQFWSEALTRERTFAPGRIGVEQVVDYGREIQVGRSREELQVHRNEDRFRKYLVSRIPGAGRASE
jgi:sporulation protein YlmC with PRC-barrel domain